MVKLVNKVIIDAYQQGASDIHIEPYPGQGQDRDPLPQGRRAHDYISVPGSYRNAIAARLKIMCDLDISERRKPQDGKIKFKKFGPLDIELRVATIPTAGGVEDIVMRILAAGEPLPLDKMGFSKRNLAAVQAGGRQAVRPVLRVRADRLGQDHDAALGAGLPQHARHEDLDGGGPGRNHAEGPAPGADESQGRADFAIAMKAFLRADPDVIMVGEMRDKETVSTGIEASLTGHLVFATLHTNSAPESIVRLLDMGMDPFNFADALLGILAQRLARRLCKCKEAHVATPTRRSSSLLDEYSQELLNTADAGRSRPRKRRAREAAAQEWVKEFGNEKGEIMLYTAKGCDVCGDTGYKGRVGLHELLIGTDRIKKNIQEHARVAEMFATALEDGMRTLKQDGIEKVLQGITDIQQVRAVCIK